MLPSSAGNDGRCLAGKSILVVEFLERHATSCIAASNFSYLLCRDFRRMHLFSLFVPAFVYFISRIISVRSEKQMKRLATVSNVAPMTDKEAIGNGAVCEFIGNAMGVRLCATASKYAIPSIVDGPKPEHASIGVRFGYSSLETTFERNVSGSYGTRKRAELLLSRNEWLPAGLARFVNGRVLGSAVRKVANLGAKPVHALFEMGHKNLEHLAALFTDFWDSSRKSLGSEVTLSATEFSMQVNWAKKWFAANFARFGSCFTISSSHLDLQSRFILVRAA